MALARVVSFEGVDSDRMAEQMREIGEEPPEGIPATDLIFLHDPDGRKALAILFFDSEEDYRRGDETLEAMPAEETPGRRVSVGKYEVALRRTV